MIHNINVSDLTVSIVIPDGLTKPAKTILYMIYPRMVGFPDNWLDTHANRYETPIAVVYVPADRWNDYLTPWPEPGETKDAQPFAGLASQFLDVIGGEVIPACEALIKPANEFSRQLLGVSLSGLFTLWQWPGCNLFESIACLSGSFWYAGFVKWFETQKLDKRKGNAYFLLGEAEPRAHIVAYRSVGDNTEAIVERLKASGIPTTFQWVPGNHFANTLGRAELALSHLLGSDG